MVLAFVGTGVVTLVLSSLLVVMSPFNPNLLGKDHVFIDGDVSIHSTQAAW